MRGGTCNWSMCDLDAARFEDQLAFGINRSPVDVIHVTKNPRLISLPPLLFDFERLTILNLSKNGLVELPPEIGQLKNLFHLGLKGNKLRVLPSTIGSLVRLAGLDLRNNMLVRLPWSMQKLRLCDIYLSGNGKLPFDDDIYSDHDEAVCMLLSCIARRYSCVGAREAVVCLWLMRKCEDGLFWKLPTDVIRYVLVPIVWATRYNEEWSSADEKAFREEIDLADLRRNFVNCED
jgi:hypothetical protein